LFLLILPQSGIGRCKAVPVRRGATNGDRVRLNNRCGVYEIKTENYIFLLLRVYISSYYKNIHFNILKLLFFKEVVVLKKEKI